MCSFGSPSPYNGFLALLAEDVVLVLVLVPLIASNCDSAWALNTFSLSNAFSNLIIRVIAFSVMLLV